MLINFHESGIVGLQNNLRVIYDDTSTIAMLGFWVKFKEIHLYVEHEVNNLIIVDDMLLLTIGESDVEKVEVDRKDDVEGVEVDGEGDVNGEGNVEGVDLDGEGVVEGGDVEGVQTDKEGDVEGVQAETDEYGGAESGGQIGLGSTIREDNDSGCGSSIEMKMLLILQHEMELTMLLLQLVEKRRMGIRVNLDGWCVYCG
ncbi:hypothetical protein Golax_001755 [Gossypium laxum]|uniref:Uncharacterized protein n=1 Tax=Gossypium laxum TaxID=34288 RepID=A0A7J9APQ1_9ROSI|nr:hypothetical protein [Gossypium laxum]